MARSKAERAKEWWAEMETLAGVYYKMKPDWGEPAPQAIFRSRPMSQHEAVSLQRNLIEVDVALSPTRHAQQRMAQRNLSAPEIEYVLLYGQSWHKAGAVIVHLRRKDLPSSDQFDQRRQQLVGTTIVMATTGARVVLTAYRNRHSGLHRIKRKVDYDRIAGRSRGK
ncbi:MAG: hypothetical protein DPW09_39685 [Anaerolineae bacterium]|nr:DUF4258 domain-containing protein [Anaerolineales bacterium]MCQ3979579.1 hypothetical protein [Anaerolineae bacterium]